MIELDKVSCGYNKKEVLKDVSITVEPSKFTCLLGKNGAGKTTLFKTILRLLPLLEGEIRYDGIDGRKIPAKQFSKLISYVPQAHGTPFPYNAVDIVLMGQYVHTPGISGKPSSKNRDIAMKCIASLGINYLAYRSFSTLSGGEKQLVLIARAMAQQTKYIAMDEPTANLDLGNQAMVLQTAAMLKEKGYGILMNTHSPQQALQYADVVILLKDGRISESGNPYKILQTKTISDLYDAPLEIIEACTSLGDKRKILINL